MKNMIAYEALDDVFSVECDHCCMNQPMIEQT